MLPVAGDQLANTFFILAVVGMRVPAPLEDWWPHLQMRPDPLKEN